MFGWLCRATYCIVLLYLLRCLVYHMLSKTRRNSSRSLHSDSVILGVHVYVRLVMPSYLFFCCIYLYLLWRDCERECELCFRKIPQHYFDNAHGDSSIERDASESRIHKIRVRAAAVLVSYAHLNRAATSGVYVHTYSYVGGAYGSHHDGEHSCPAPTASTMI